jgi:hypothetical protein
MLFDTNSSSYRHPNVLIFFIIGIFIIYKAEKIINKDLATGRFALIPPFSCPTQACHPTPSRRPGTPGHRPSQASQSVVVFPDRKEIS